MLENRVVLVTHVRHFVGLAAARALAAEGAQVACHDTTFVEAPARQAFVEEYPGLQAMAEQDAEALARAVAGQLGDVDVLVNNDAFPAIRASAEEARSADFRATLEALAVAPLALTGAVVPAMKARRRGKILFVTSAAPLLGLANYAMYVAARGAANALVLSLARELAPHNVHVNAVAPNYVESPTYFPPALLADPEKRAKMERNIPLGRLGRPEEVARVIAFLASDGSDFVTGHVMPVAGGWA